MLNELNQHDDDLLKIKHLKLKIYRVIAPAGVVSVLGITFLEASYHSITWFDYLIRGIISLVYLTFTIILLVNKKYVFWFEKSIFFIVALFFVAQFYKMLVSLAFSQPTEALYTFPVWMPMVYFMAHLSFDLQRALKANLVFYGLLFLPGMLFLLGNWQAQHAAYLDNLFVSSLIYIFSIYAAGQLLVMFVQARATASAMHKMANLDFLTGLSNRRFLDVTLDELFQNFVSTDRPISVIIFDVDHFKQINDRYGHLMGDQVLSEMAAIVRKQARAADYVGRWGGDEFLLVATDTRSDQACLIAERMRRMVAEKPLAGLSLTASFGVAEWMAGDSPESLLGRADAALYRAKQTARNQVAAG